MQYIDEQIKTPVKYECDVCVCGGGIAGIAAALSAARAGAEVILLERVFMLGGLATAGLVTIYLALCDGLGNQVAFGIVEELIRLSIEHGAEDKYPAAWLCGGSKNDRAKQRFEVQYNAQMFAISAERLLLREGVKILYGAPVAGVNMNDNKISEIIIEGKSGREAIKVRKSVVDATGDADVCSFSGAKTDIYRDGNRLAAWYYGYGDKNYKLYMCGVYDVAPLEGQTDLPDIKRYSGLDTEELSEMIETAHASLQNNCLSRRDKIKDLMPVTMFTIPQVRMTRRLCGAYTQDITEDRMYHEDSVGLYPNWKKLGPVYELPLSALYGNEVKNLAVAGRCISVSDEMWDVARVIPVCAVSGEAAGAAAAMGDDLSKVDIKKLQEHLRNCGVKLHSAELEIQSHRD